MSIAKKGSRNITVDDQKYRYIITQRRNENEYDTILTIQSENDGNQTCQLVTRGNIITPGIIKNLINYALNNGWKPNQKGSMFTIKESNIKNIIDCLSCRGCGKFFPVSDFEDLTYQFCAKCI